MIMKFLNIIFNVSRFFLFFEKTLMQGDKDALLSELRECRNQLGELRQVCLNNQEPSTKENEDV